MDLHKGVGEFNVNELDKISTENGADRTELDLESRNRQGNDFSEYKFQKDFVKSQVDDARVKHCLCSELSNDMKDMRPLPNPESAFNDTFDKNTLTVRHHYRYPRG